MLTSTLTNLRESLYQAITSPRGDGLAAVRIPKDLARRLNVALGKPLATREELEKRERARERLRALQEQPTAAAAGDTPTATASAAQGAPIVIYFEKDRNVRALQRIEEILGARGLTWKRLEVGGDEATLDFVLREAHCERDELPIVFLGDRAIGGHVATAQADLAGELPRGGATGA
jgi:hypothetical protein